MNKYIKFQYSIIHILWIIQLVIQISSSSSINILHCLKGDVQPSSTFEKKIYMNNFSETVLFLSKPVKAAVKGYKSHNYDVQQITHTRQEQSILKSL